MKTQNNKWSTKSFREHLKEKLKDENFRKEWITLQEERKIGKPLITRISLI